MTSSEGANANMLDSLKKIKLFDNYHFVFLLD